MILVDSSVWIDYFCGRISKETEVLDGLLGSEPVAIGDLILVEVLQGFRSDSDYRTAKRLLTTLTIFPLLNTKLAIKSADNFRVLRKKGVTVRKAVDSIIATFCIENDHHLLFSDKDFIPFVMHLGLRTLA
jgi:predicted nucleic acid-binding protein